jgi:hypothetical protein
MKPREPKRQGQNKGEKKGGKQRTLKNKSKKGEMTKSKK